MVQRTDTELKVFLNGDYESQYSKLTDKSGTVFFDKTRRAVYAEGVLITSDVVDIKVEGSVLKVIKVGETEYTDLADLAIPNEFVRFNEAQNLTDVQKQTARTNIGAEAADDTILKQGNVVNNLTSDSTTAPLSAAQGKELKKQIDKKVTAETGKGLSTNDYTDGDKTKLDGIDDNAQTNREVTVNGNPIGRDNEENQSTIKIKGNLVTAPNNGEDSEIEFYLSHKYYPTENKIRFFKTATPPDVYNETTNGPDVVLTIDTSDFVKDSFVEKVEFNKVTSVLSITFVYADGSKNTIPIDLSTLMNLYTAGKGLTETINDEGSTTFVVALGKGLAFDTSNAITLSLGNGLSFDNSGKLVVDFASNGVTSINGMGGGAYTINTEGVTVGTTGNVLRPIEVVNDSAAKKLKIKARPADMLAQFFRENKNKENATSGIRAKGVLIEEAEGGNPYSMLMDFTPKVWQF